MSASVVVADEELRRTKDRWRGDDDDEADHDEPTTTTMTTTTTNDHWSTWSRGLAHLGAP